MYFAEQFFVFNIFFFHFTISGCPKNQGLNETYAEMKNRTKILGAVEQSVTAPNPNPSIDTGEENRDQTLKIKDPFARLFMDLQNRVENNKRHNNLRIRIPRDGKSYN